ncbi:hypothetical protein [Paenibacillus andongensis]|uniref:hypothetical protein n=1 Tax=Paenibacillus andongensis TaxID=2975482 RepID=UPI0021BA9985|nr:hypothetical protein [Paenibacillus andongensis]
MEVVMDRLMPVKNVVKISNQTVRKPVNWRQHAAGYLFLASLLCVMAVFFVYAF